MCYYRFWVYDVCGHSTMSAHPIEYCTDALPNSHKPSHHQYNPLPSSSSPATYHPDNRSSTFSTAPTATDSIQESTPESSPPRPQAESSTSQDPTSQDPEHHTPHSPPRNSQESQHSSPSHTPPKIHNPHSHSRHSNPKPCKTHLVHPYQSYKLHSLCPQCAHNRSTLLSIVESGNEVKIEDWKWKVKYMSPVPPSQSTDRHAHSRSTDRHTDTHTSHSQSNTSRYSGATETEQNNGLGLNLGEIGEAMGSWVKGKGVELGAGMGILGVVREEGGSVKSSGSDKAKAKKRRSGEAKRSVDMGLRGGMPSS